MVVGSLWLTEQSGSSQAQKCGRKSPVSLRNLRGDRLPVASASSSWPLQNNPRKDGPTQKTMSTCTSVTVDGVVPCEGSRETGEPEGVSSASVFGVGIAPSSTRLKASCRVPARVPRTWLFLYPASSPLDFSATSVCTCMQDVYTYTYMMCTHTVCTLIYTYGCVCVCVFF